MIWWVFSFFFFTPSLIKIHLCRPYKWTANVTLQMNRKCVQDTQLGKKGLQSLNINNDNSPNVQYGNILLDCSLKSSRWFFLLLLHFWSKYTFWTSQTKSKHTEECSTGKGLQSLEIKDENGSKIDMSNFNSCLQFYFCMNIWQPYG